MKSKKTVALLVSLIFLLSVAVAMVSYVQASANAVVIENNAFNPDKITVTQGTTVTWTNKDNVIHSVFSDLFGPDAEPVFVSGSIHPGGTYSFTFDQVGTWGYHDDGYPSMTGTVIVVASGSSTSGQSGNGGSIAGENVNSTNLARVAVAHLDTNNVPGVGNATNSTHAQGMALFWTDQNLTEMSYMLFVSNATNLTMAHVHQFVNGTPGEDLAWLYPQNTPPTTQPQPINGVSDGMFVVGNLTASDLVGPLKNKTIGDFVALMENGTTGVAWHSTEYPSGYMVGSILTNMSSPINATLLKELGPQHRIQAGNNTSGG